MGVLFVTVRVDHHTVTDSGAEGLTRRAGAGGRLVTRKVEVAGEHGAIVDICHYFLYDSGDSGEGLPFESLVIVLRRPKTRVCGDTTGR